MSHHTQRYGSTSHKALNDSGGDTTDLTLAQYVSIPARSVNDSGCCAASTSALVGVSCDDKVKGIRIPAGVTARKGYHGGESEGRHCPLSMRFLSALDICSEKSNLPTVGCAAVDCRRAGFACGNVPQQMLGGSKTHGEKTRRLDSTIEQNPSKLEQSG